MAAGPQSAGGAVGLRGARAGARGRFPGGLFPSGPGNAGQFPGGTLPGGLPGGVRGGLSGGLGNETANAQIVQLLQADAGVSTWAAATIGANSAAPLELATGQSVMAIGGFTGSDPAPALAQFQGYVAQGEVHYFIAGGRGAAGGLGVSGSDRAAGGTGTGSTGGLFGQLPGGGGTRGASSGTATQITEWVTAHYTAETVGGVTVYDLTRPLSGSGG